MSALLENQPEVLKQSVAELDGRIALLVQRCADCGKVSFPVGRACLCCGSAALEREPLSREGRVFSWTAIHRAAAGWKVPYVVALVDFPEGPRIFAQVDAAPAQMQSGMAVCWTFGVPPAGLPAGAYYFEPATP